MAFKYNRRYNFSIFCVLLLVLFEIGHIHSLPSNPKAEEWNNRLQSLKEQRDSLIDQLWDLQAQLDDMVKEYRDAFKGDEEKVLILVRELKKLLQTIDGLSNDIFELIDTTENAEESKKEKERQKELKDDVSETLFNAKARKCKSSEEAFYHPLMKCFKIGEPGPCNENEWLYEIEGTNEGLCDCKTQVGFVYHTTSEGCYWLNTQGPCETGEWLIYDSKTDSTNHVKCDYVPDKNCILDGAHVFYGDRCWKLGSKGPCANGQILDRNSENLGIIECSIDPSLDSFSFSDKV